MFINRLIKNQVFLFAFSFVILGTLIIGISAAYFKNSFNVQDTSFYSGHLNVRFNDINSISFSTDPIDDVTAYSLYDNIYSFSIMNDPDLVVNDDDFIPYSYRIYLKKDNNNLGDDIKFVKYCLSDVDSGIELTQENCSSEYWSDVSKEQIPVGERLALMPGETNHYRLKIWIAKSDANGNNISNSVIGKNVGFKINVCGQSGNSLDGMYECREDN